MHGTYIKMAPVYNKRGKFTENHRDRSHYVNIKCYYCPSISRRLVETLAVTQVAKLLRELRETGMLIAVFTVGTYLSQMNSACTVIYYLFMALFNNIIVSNINCPFALPIVFNSKISFMHFSNTPTYNCTININVLNDGLHNKYTD